jgi:hypothetical protein
LKECGGITGWLEAMKRAARSPHLTGRNERDPKYEKWWPDFDFMITQSKFTKLLEGGYDDKSRNSGGSGAGGVLDRAAEVMRLATTGRDI